LIHELEMKFPFFKPKSFLDFGAGLGSSSIYILEKFPQCDIKAVEPNENMRNLGKFLCNKKPNIHYYQNLFDSLIFKDSNKFDIVYCSFVLEEIKSAEERLIVID